MGKAIPFSTDLPLYTLLACLLSDWCVSGICIPALFRHQLPAVHSPCDSLVSGFAELCNPLPSGAEANDLLESVYRGRAFSA